MMKRVAGVFASFAMVSEGSRVSKQGHRRRRAPPTLVDSAWPITHQNFRQTGASRLPGLAKPSPLQPPQVQVIPSSEEFGFQQIVAMSNPITLLFEEGNQHYWGHGLGGFFRARVSSGDEDEVILCESGSLDFEFHGAYSFVNSEGDYFYSLATTISRVRPRLPWQGKGGKGTTSGCGAFAKTDFEVPNMAEGDYLVGMVLSPDGVVMYVTQLGLMGTVSQDFQRVGGQLDLSELGKVSNSIAQDGEGGVFTVTSQNVIRVDWDGQTLQLAWSMPHGEGRDPLLPGRLGTGVGSTPSIMDTGANKYVVITDGQVPMNVLLYRTADGALVANETVDFQGNGLSTSEQSVAVSGNKLLVVNNFLGFASDYKDWQLLLNQQPFLTGRVAYGAMQFAWDETTQTLRQTWSNPNISCASSIPTISEDSNTPYAYCIGKRGPPVYDSRCFTEDNPVLARLLGLDVANTSRCGNWTLEAMSWETGASVFHVRLGDTFRYNPQYAATQIGPDGTMYAGTQGGYVKVSPKRL